MVRAEYSIVALTPVSRLWMRASDEAQYIIRGWLRGRMFSCELATAEEASAFAKRYRVPMPEVPRAE